MDTQDTTGPDTGVATETQPSDISAESGQVAPEGSQGQEETAGDSQGFSESGKDQGTDTRRPFRSKNQTIYELRQKLRERDGYWESEVGTLKEQLAELSKFIKPRGQDPKTSRTFWEAPEDVHRQLTRDELRTFKEELVKELRQSEAEKQETVEWKQETSEAAKFIQSQKGFTEDDYQEIAEIVREHPSMNRLRPMERAEYALFLFQKEKGVGDKTTLKRQAASVNGSGSQSSNALKTWTEDEMDREIKKFPPDPRAWSDEDKRKFDTLDTEFRRAYREGRVKKKI